MPFSEPHSYTAFKGEIRQLFYQRTHVSLWLGVVFFSLFLLLDLTCCRANFSHFFFYRLVFVAALLCFINVLRLQLFREYAPHLMSAAMLLGAMVISLMAVELGGFHSGYYVGLLLMITGALSVLPLRGSQALIAGISLFVIYFLTVTLGTGDLSTQHMKYAVNNTFFFFSIVGVAAVQSHDEMKTLLKELGARESIKKIRRELVAHTDDLEKTVQQRLAELEETHLKYRDLYNNILDLVVLIDSQGIIQKINRQCLVMLEKEPDKLVGEPIISYIQPADNEKNWLQHLLARLEDRIPVEGLQLNLRNDAGELIEVEMSASTVEIAGEPRYFQFILRDISANKAMERQLLESERLIGTSRQAAIFGLARLAECRDDDTGAHLSRIRSYTCLLCRELAKCKSFQDEVTERFIEDILHSSALHDIGKVGIPDSILLKPGKLDQEEFELMKQHCIFGSETLSAAENFDETISFLQIGRDIARSHHEKWDGTGYPDGLSGDNIPLSARIIALADVYDALTSIRVYKPAYNHETTKTIIAQQSGKQFDPRIVRAFLRVEHMFKEARMRLAVHQSDAI